MKFKKISSFLLGTLLGLSFLTGSINAEEISARRISGINRYETSIRSSREFSQSDYLIIASGKSYSDALFGSALASQENSPLLLTDKNTLYPSIPSEIRRLGVKEVFVLGGTDSISSSIDSYLKSLGVSVTRLSGMNRTETATAINNKRIELESKRRPGLEYLNAGVDGSNFPDALVAGSFVGQSKPGNNIVLLHPGYGSNYDWFFGGAMGYTRRSFAGKDRYETASIVATMFKGSVESANDTIILANGQSYPDALSASSLSAKYKAPILLTPSRSTSKFTLDYIKRNNIKNIIAVGGEDSINTIVLISYKMGKEYIPFSSKPHTSVEVIHEMLNEERFSSDSSSTTESSNGTSNSNTSNSSSTNKNKTRELYTGGNGKVKANKDSGIYHIPGSTYYDRFIKIDNIEWFDTEQEAINAGYIEPEK